MSQTTSSPILVRSEDRRRQPRQKVSSITYLEFGDDNGGILLNLGGGGLSLQAVARLNPGQELTLRFGLFNDGETTAVPGRVIWLSPTRKEAGICFEGLSESAAEVIDKWFAAQDAERISAEWKAAADAEPEPAKNEIHLLPQFSAASGGPKITPSDLDAEPNPSDATLSEVRIGDSLLDHALNRAKTSPVFGTYVPTMTPTRLVSYPKEQRKPIELPAPAPEIPRDAKPPAVRLFRPIPPESSIDSRPMNPVIQDVPAQVDQAQIVHAPIDSPAVFSPPSTASVTPGNHTLAPMSALTSEQANRRTMQISAGVAACIGILLLLFMTATMGRRATGDVSIAPMGAQNISPAARADVTAKSAAAVGSPNATSGRGVARTRTASSPPQQQSNASAVAANGTAVNSEQTSAPAQITPQIVQQGSDSSWLEALKQTFFGVQDAPKLDPAVSRVEVWADQRTGFYYCDNGPYFVKPERVSLLSQGDALQSGFQPKLGTYCY